MSQNYYFVEGSNTVGVRPDLLCGENKFPQVLDPTVPDGLIGTNGNITANGSSSEEQLPNAAHVHFQANFVDAAQSGPGQQVMYRRKNTYLWIPQ